MILFADIFFPEDTIMPRVTVEYFKYLEYEEFAREVSVRMQEQRIQKKISQSEMAKKIGTSKAYISNIENGKTKCPAYILNAYCRILSVSPETLLLFTLDNSIEKEIMDAVNLLSIDEKRTVCTMVKSLVVEKQRKA